jgi:hypothetical protein
MLIVKSSIFGTILNQQNIRETNLYLSNSYMCWLDKSFASKYKLDKYWPYEASHKMNRTLIWKI